jgi:hypothetical protein
MIDFDERVLALADRLKTGWELCDFLGVTEREVMVFQTIRACRLNVQEGRGLFSYRGDGCIKDKQFGGSDNASAYSYLVDKEFFVEGKHDGKVTIVPTMKLITKLEVHLDKKG